MLMTFLSQVVILFSFILQSLFFILCQAGVHSCFKGEMAPSVCMVCGEKRCTCRVEETAPLQLQTEGFRKENNEAKIEEYLDQFDRNSLYWGITDDGFVAFSDDAKLLKGACGKSLASSSYGCFFSTSICESRSYKNPSRMIIAAPAAEEEMWGATSKVEGSSVLAA